jgi:hypothetical protein
MPTFLSGVISGLVFVFTGDTPVIRALGMSAAIVGVALTLRRFGGILSMIGSLALAFSPAFWSQTGGVETTPSVLWIGLIVTGIVAGGLVFQRKPVIGLAAAVIIFVGIFWLSAGTGRSLRLTTLFSAWLLYLLISAVMLSHPRPGIQPQALKLQHTAGMLLLFGIGVVNDPLLTLMAPAIALTWGISQTRIPRWYWGIFITLTVIGLRGLIVQYADSGWWLYPAEQAEARGLQVPFLLADGWREASRWIDMIDLISNQFTVMGIALGLIGLSRLSRWYPPLGVLTLILYAGYALFGLIYFGGDRTVLLLPLLMIQVIWMTYAVFALSQWLQKSLDATSGMIRWAAPAVFALLPALLLWRILQSG